MQIKDIMSTGAVTRWAKSWIA